MGFNVGQFLIVRGEDPPRFGCSHSLVVGCDGEAATVGCLVLAYFGEGGLRVEFSSAGNC